MKHLHVLLIALCICQSTLLYAEQTTEPVKNRTVKRKEMVKQGVKELKSSLQEAGTKIVKSIEKGKEKVMNLVTNAGKSNRFTPEDFKFDELKKIDLSQCKKLDVKEIKTKFDKPAWFVKTEGTTVSVNIKFRNEGARSFRDKPYLLTLMCGCVAENVGMWGVGGFKRTLKEQAIELSLDFDSDNVIMSFSCLRDQYDLALSLACELMMQSLLPESSIERTKAELIDNLHQSKVTPLKVASEKMSRLVEVKEYAFSFDEGLKMIPTYKRDDVENCYKTLFDARNAEITVVGNVSEEKITTGLNKVYEAIKDRHNNFKGGEQRTELMSPSKYEHCEVENENATVVCALPGVAITDEDKYAIRTANRIWGNIGLSCRLFVDIREKQHLVYAIWSKLHDRDLQSGLSIVAKTNPQYIKAVIDGVKKSCEELAEKGITEDEFLSDRIGIVASHVLHSPSAIMSYVLARRADGATVATVDDYLDKYAKLTVADVNKVLKKVFDVEKMVIVSAGKTVPQVDKAQAHNRTVDDVTANAEPADIAQLKSTVPETNNAKDEKNKNEKSRTTTGTPEKKSNTEFPIEEAYLENGLRIVVCNMPCSKDAVFFGIGYYVGSADDPRDIVGASHFLEHMAFKESKNIPAGKMDHYLTTFNNYTNAFTCEDITFYTQHCNKAFLDADLRLESERMHNAKFLDETVKAETNVILAEREMREGSDPYIRYIDEALLKDIYLYSNYSNSVIGYPDQITACNFENLKKHYETHYTPDNAVAIFVGDIDINKAKELCQRNFGHIKRGKGIKRNRVVDPEDIDISRIVTYRNPQIKQKRLGLFYKIPRKNIATIKQEIVIEMVNEMLFGSDSSIIRDKICNQFELAHSVRSYIQKFSYDFAFLNIELDVNGIDARFDELESKIEKTIDNFIKMTSPTEKTINERFEKLKKSFKNKYEQMFDNPDAMNWMLITNIMIFNHSINEIKNVIDIVDTITFDDFMNTAKELLEPKRRILVVHYEPSVLK